MGHIKKEDIFTDEFIRELYNSIINGFASDKRKKKKLELLVVHIKEVQDSTSKLLVELEKNIKSLSS